MRERIRESGSPISVNALSCCMGTPRKYGWNPSLREGFLYIFAFNLRRQKLPAVSRNSNSLGVAVAAVLVIIQQVCAFTAQLQKLD